MPVYTFECDKEDGGCNCIFEIKTSMNKIKGCRPSCPSCKKKKFVHRAFDVDVSLYVVNRTVGAVSDSNTSKFSEDEKQHLTREHTAYRRPFTGNLPKGAKTKERD